MKDDRDSFKVVDKRHDREDGMPDPAASVASTPSEEPVLEGEDGASDDQASKEMPPAEFTSLVISIATSAYLHLGEIPDPDSKHSQVNLDLARHSIDLLALLRDKTRGNLTDEEQRILERFLYDLRMKYVVKTQG